MLTKLTTAYHPPSIQISSHLSYMKQDLTISAILRTCAISEQIQIFSFKPFSLLLFVLERLSCQRKKNLIDRKLQISLDTNIHTQPVGSRLCQIRVLHARLQMDCSSINPHRYSRNIVASALCSCVEFQSVHPFFFIFPNYSEINNTMTHQKVSVPTLQTKPKVTFKCLIFLSYYP